METYDIHKKFMYRVLEIALRGQGSVSPNPLVGCVIVENEKIIAEGYHEMFGKSHAEVNAINSLPSDYDFTNCTLYVNLEPCSHFGKTPPCVDLVIKKKFNTVVIGATDQNPIVEGKGINKLLENNIKVIKDVLNEESVYLNRAFFKKIKTGLPFVFLKMAQTIDGFIADSYGTSKWITCDESLKTVHKLRSMSDSILIGSGTALSDNPSLTVRHVEGLSPWRILLTGERDLPENLNLFNDDMKLKTIVLAKPHKIDNFEKIKLNGVHLFNYVYDDNNEIDLMKTLKIVCEKFGFNSIMVEGGAITISEFMKINFFDEIHLFIAPKILSSGKGSFSFLEKQKLNESKFNLKITKLEQVGSDVLVIMSNNCN